MDDKLAQIVTADDISEAMKGWVVGEVKEAGNRYFELAKFFFGVSVGTYAVIPFLANLDLAIEFDNFCDLLPLFLLAISTLSAIAMAVPVSFSVDHKINVVSKHRRFVRKQRFLIALWFVSWLSGVIFILASFDQIPQQYERPAS